MSKQHIVFLDEEEIKAVMNMCQATLTMGAQAAEGNFFSLMETEAKTVLDKLQEKKNEFDGK